MRILEALGRGEPLAASELLPLVYDELRRLAAHRLARETPGHTLQATALVHEEIAATLGITVYLARQKWTYARAWLRDAIGG